LLLILLTLLFLLRDYLILDLLRENHVVLERLLLPSTLWAFALAPLGQFFALFFLVHLPCHHLLLHVLLHLHLLNLIRLECRFEVLGALLVVLLDLFLVLLLLILDLLATAHDLVCGSVFKDHLLGVNVPAFG